MWLALVGTAAALAPGLLVPAATLEAPGHGSVGGFGALGTATLFHFGGGRAAVGVTPALTMEALVVGAPVGGVAWVGARYALWRNDSLTVAPWLVAGAAWSGGASGEDRALGIGVTGVALEGGWERVRIDLSVPLVLVGAPGLDPAVAPLLPAIASTAGLSVRLGERHVLRAGIEPLGSPAASWAFVADRWYTRVHVGAAMLGAVPTGGVEAGVRW